MSLLLTRKSTQPSVYPTGLCGAVRVVTALAALCLLASSALALDYGQIKGKVTDNQTKEPLIGASVAIVGTDLGAITDVDGTYSIRLVPPGDYTLEITAIGYQAITVEQVRVFSELTTEQDAKMSSETLDIGDKIVVEAQAQTIDKFEVSSSTKIQREAIQRAPVQTVD
ncbi:MAG TPA: carboxypeptidase-like regulatory domain-containing protein, partial [candidate division Zixibacteria bacterium]|nr:carboxypeptidase-like regulatory domain-containing protein [candidate division Zixibacteria bacterium]